MWLEKGLLYGNKVNNDTIISFEIIIESIILISFSLFFNFSVAHCFAHQRWVKLWVTFQVQWYRIAIWLFVYFLCHSYHIPQSKRLASHYNEVTWVGQCFEHLIGHKHIPGSKHEALCWFAALLQMFLSQPVELHNIMKIISIVIVNLIITFYWWSANYCLFCLCFQCW